jgi:SAM-dependent methyltransferase
VSLLRPQQQTAVYGPSPSSVARANPPAGPTYLFEQVTPFFEWARQNRPGQVMGSEYLGPGRPAGGVVDGTRHEDALALSFEDGLLSVVVSNDVFEHVPDIDQALRECARVLSADGLLLFSVPFYEASDVTKKRAEFRDGEVVELLPAEYHGNPISEKGSLVFYEHGWDLLGRCRQAGFADVYLLGYWSFLRAISAPVSRCSS